MTQRHHDLAGKKFGDLTVVEISRRQPHKSGVRLYWRCRCICGIEIEARADGLRCGDYRSCGCKKVRQLTEHGCTGTPEHKVWISLFQRCRNPRNRDFAQYGGRGIDICDQWAGNFSAFLEHIGSRPSSAHSIDRIDNNRGYEPGNIRWATGKEQARNRRNSAFVMIDGIRTPIAEVAERNGVPYSRYYEYARRNSLLCLP